MAGIELCQCFLREKEPEVAELWCSDCSEAVCQSCGKAHRRLTDAHHVILLSDTPACKKNIPKNCTLHENKNLFLFCVGHDKLICHECLLESHGKCNKLLEIEKASEGIKGSATINDMKERMKKLTSVLEKIQIENDQQLSKISKSKESTVDHMKEVLQRFKYHSLQIENDQNVKYEKIEKHIADIIKQSLHLRKDLQENMDWLCTLESSSSECNIFHAVKHLDTILVSSEKQVEKMKNDLITIPLDVLPPEGTKFIDNIFQELHDKTKLKTMPAITILPREYKQSHIKVERASQPPPPPYQELTSNNNSMFGACCLTEDGRLVVEELFLSKHQSPFRYCLRLFDFQTSQSEEILVSTRYDRKYLYRGSICMYNKTLVLLVSDQDITGIMVIDMKLHKICKTIYPQRSKGLGKVKEIKWISCKGGKIYILAESNNGIWLCSIDFNGRILSEFNLPLSVAYIDFDGLNRFYYTDDRVNDILCISIDREWTTSKCYSSLDLKECCQILHMCDDEILLLESDTKTVYTLDIGSQHRSILSHTHIVNKPTYFNSSLKFKKVAILMDGGKCIRIFPF